MDHRPQQYGTFMVLLHWLIALLILGGWLMGTVIEGIPLSPLKLKLLAYHKWNGVTVFLLAFVRLSWRWARGTPPLPSSMPGWQQQAAVWTHRLMYLLMFAIPLSGWLMSSAKGVPVVYFGLVPLPDLVDKNPGLAELLKDVHKTMVDGLLLLLLVHVGAALKHQFIDRDEILARMLPFLRQSPP